MSPARTSFPELSAQTRERLARLLADLLEARARVREERREQRRVG